MFEQAIAWCYQTPMLSWLRDARYGMPLAQSFHILGFTVLLGTCVTWNLALTGLGFRKTSLDVLARDLWPWANGGLVLVVATGIMVFIVDPARYVVNAPFQTKMALLVLAIAFQYTLFKRTLFALDKNRLTPARRWRIAAASVGLWFGVGWAGRFIAFL